MMEAAVDLREVEPGIVQVTMQDRVNKNTLSYELTLGLIEAFKSIHDNPNYKVVVLTGYDSYFCTGGTQEGLLAICDGKTSFTDVNIYSLALECKIPVISAMQGHGIGGGFALGLYADFVVMSREGVYSTNFMKYGFTPGMGATYIVTKKLGFSLGEEMLLNGGIFRGADLEKRGIPFPVIPREKVMAYALELAQQVAEKPRFSLITLKDHLVAPLREELPGIIEKELIMHDKTFHQPEVKDRINALFGR
jgi:polyketide biosynthesis enoyl-CoA hydratase PksI